MYKTYVTYKFEYFARKFYCFDGGAQKAIRKLRRKLTRTGALLLTNLIRGDKFCNKNTTRLSESLES